MRGPPRAAPHRPDRRPGRGKGRRARNSCARRCVDTSARCQSQRASCSAVDFRAATTSMPDAQVSGPSSTVSASSRPWQHGRMSHRAVRPRYRRRAWPGPEPLWPSVGTSLDEQLSRYYAVIHLRTPVTGYKHEACIRQRVNAHLSPRHRERVEVVVTDDRRYPGKRERSGVKPERTPARLVGPERATPDVGPQPVRADEHIEWRTVSSSSSTTTSPGVLCMFFTERPKRTSTRPSMVSNSSRSRSPLGKL